MSNNAFVEQIETLIRLGYPAMLAMPEPAFINSLAVLESRLPTAQSRRRASAVCDCHQLLPRAPIRERCCRWHGGQGKVSVERLFPRKPNDFVPQIELPGGEAYLLVDVDRGADFRNITPDAAYLAITKGGRSPLTISEGIAVLTHAPDLLQPNMCFSLLASRCGDKSRPFLPCGSAKAGPSSAGAGRAIRIPGWVLRHAPHAQAQSTSIQRRSIPPDLSANLSPAGGLP